MIGISTWLLLSEEVLDGIEDKLGDSEGFVLGPFKGLNNSEGFPLGPSDGLVLEHFDRSALGNADGLILGNINRIKLLVSAWVELNVDDIVGSWLGDSEGLLLGDSDSILLSSKWGILEGCSDIDGASDRLSFIDNEMQ